MVGRGKSFRADEAGAAMVEMAIALPLLLTLLLGFVDFGYAFYQWNAANKAVQVGARLAVVSNPIAEGVEGEAGLPADIVDAGSAVGADTYHYTCGADDAGTASCTCTAGTCSGLDADQEAFDRIFYGDDFGDKGCVGGARPGMCDFFPALVPSEVQVEYAATGLGFWGRPGGAVPTIKVSIVGHQFQFFFIAGLLILAKSTIKMPDMLSTVTGEDLDSSSP
jgi:hypothetical protein